MLCAILRTFQLNIGRFRLEPQFRKRQACMTERIPKSVILVALAMFISALAYGAYTRHWYFASQSNLPGLILLELRLAPVWSYWHLFSSAILVAFPFAPVLFVGINLAVGRCGLPWRLHPTTARAAVGGITF